jgi:hypothetical protein
MNEKSLDCLQYAALDYTEERNVRFKELSAKYSEKAVIRKLENLTNLGYLEYGVGPIGAWLTDKGRAAIELPIPPRYKTFFDIIHDSLKRERG